MEKFNNYKYLNLICDKEIYLKDFLKDKGLTSRFIRKEINDKNIYLNYENTIRNNLLKCGDIISLKLEDEELNGKIQNLNIEIIYEDDDLLVVNKPPFIPTHTSKGHSENTLLNYICGYFNQNKINRKVRFVNRLDSETSGIVIVAKNQFTHGILELKFKNSIIKKYVAITEGRLNSKNGYIENYIKKSEEGIKREVSLDEGKFAKTYYKVIKQKGNLNLVSLRLYTGRTHQIRVHLENINSPILGDKLYYKSSELINRQALHANYIKFIHPRTEDIMEFSINLPKDMDNIVNHYLS